MDGVGKRFSELSQDIVIGSAIKIEHGTLGDLKRVAGGPLRQAAIR